MAQWTIVNRADISPELCMCVWWRGECVAGLWCGLYPRSCAGVWWWVCKHHCFTDLWSVIITGVLSPNTADLTCDPVCSSAYQFGCHWTVIRLVFVCLLFDMLLLWTWIYFWYAKVMYAVIWYIALYDRVDLISSV